MFSNISVIRVGISLITAGICLTGQLPKAVAREVPLLAQTADCEAAKNTAHSLGQELVAVLGTEPDFSGLSPTEILTVADALVFVGNAFDQAFSCSDDVYFAEHRDNLYLGATHLLYLISEEEEAGELVDSGIETWCSLPENIQACQDFTNSNIDAIRGL